MSEERGVFRRYRPWLVGGLVGGIVGALVVDLAPQILPTEIGLLGARLS